MPTSTETDIIEFQKIAASGWLHEGDDLETVQLYSRLKLQFILYFTAFNATYWLWGKFHPPTKTGEVPQIQALIERLDGAVVHTILTNHASYIQWLRVRRTPVLSMKDRTRTDARGSSTRGAVYKRELADPDDKVKLKALASILYLVRCNLVHGSKRAGDGYGRLVDDGVAPLRAIAEACLDHTKKSPPA